jgi:hypothetical protein
LKTQVISYLIQYDICLIHSYKIIQIWQLTVTNSKCMQTICMCESNIYRIESNINRSESNVKWLVELFYIIFCGKPQIMSVILVKIKRKTFEFNHTTFSKHWLFWVHGHFISQKNFVRILYANQTFFTLVKNGSNFQ